MTLLREDSGHAAAPALLDGIEQAQFVIYENVVVGRIATLNVVEHLILMNVDQNATIYGFP